MVVPHIGQSTFSSDVQWSKSSGLTRISPTCSENQPYILETRKDKGGEERGTPAESILFLPYQRVVFQSRRELAQIHFAEAPLLWTAIKLNLNWDKGAKGGRKTGKGRITSLLKSWILFKRLSHGPKHFWVCFKINIIKVEGGGIPLGQRVRKRSRMGVKIFSPLECREVLRQRTE